MVKEKLKTMIEEDRKAKNVNSKTQDMPTHSKEKSVTNSDKLP